MLKKLIACAFLLFASRLSHAQFYKSVMPSAEFNQTLEKIVSDFRYDFKNIRGAVTENAGEYDIYQSAVTLPGASDCTINTYRSAMDTTSSWQGVLYRGDDYREAVKAYRNTFRLMNKSRMQIIDRSVVGFSGRMEEPTEDLRFAVSSLYLDIADPRYRRFIAEIELVSNYEGWQVNVNFFNKKPDNEQE